MKINLFKLKLSRRPNKDYLFLHKKSTFEYFPISIKFLIH